MVTGSVISDLLIALTVGLFAWHVRSERRSGRWSVFDPLNFFWAGVFVIYVIEALSNYDTYVAWYGEETVQETLFWIFFGIVFVHLGYRLLIGGQLAQRLPALPAQLADGPLLFLSVVLMIGGAIGWGLIIESAGGLMSWASVARGAVEWETLSGYVGTLSDLFYVGVILFLLYSEWKRQGAVARVLAWLLLAFLFVFFLYVGTRSRLILVVMVALMAWSLPRRRNPPFVVLIPVFCGLLLITSFQANYRDRFTDFSLNLDTIDWDEVPTIVLPRFIVGHDKPSLVTRGSEFSITAAVMQLVPDQVPYAMGVEFLQVFTQPIPREWWPEKRYPKNESWTPIHLLAGSSEYWVDHVHVPFLAGPAPGFTGSWYYNGGALGLIIGGMLVGILLRACRGVYDRATANQSYFVIYFMVAPVGFGEAVSHPFSFIYSLPLLLVPLVGLLLIIRRSRRGARIAGPFPVRP